MPVCISAQRYTRADQRWFGLLDVAAHPEKSAALKTQACFLYFLGWPNLVATAGLAGRDKARGAGPSLQANAVNVISRHWSLFVNANVRHCTLLVQLAGTTIYIMNSNSDLNSYYSYNDEYDRPKLAKITRRHDRTEAFPSPTQSNV